MIAAPTFQERWAESVADYGTDVVRFAEEQWIVKDTGRLIVLEPHQRQILRLMLTRGGVSESQHQDVWDQLTEAGRERMRVTPEGRFPWADMIFSARKKSGKSELGGIVGLWVTLSERGINETFYVANDQEQSMGRGYTRIIDHLNPASPCYNPIIAGLLRTRIRPNIRPPVRLDFLAGDFIRAIPTDYAGEAGANPTISVWDEIWAATKEALSRLWEEFTVVPTRRNSVRFVTTYAGFRDESDLLWSMYQRAVRRGVRVHESLPIYESAAGDTVAYWDHEARMPWQTAEYYRAEKARLRPNSYRRLHLNQWTRSVSAFIDPDAWDQLPRTGLKPPASKAFPVYIGVDASHKRDATAGVAVGWHTGGYPFLVRHQIWRPAKQEPVIPEDTVGPWLEDMAQQFDVRRIGADPNHMETLIYRLQAQGLPVEEFQQTPDNLSSAADALFTFTRQGLLLLYPETDLTQHVLSCTAKETPRGWRLAKELARRHIDGAVALATALAIARQHGPTDVEAGPILFWLGGGEEREL